jgi:hypothetical protein
MTRFNAVSRRERMRTPTGHLVTADELLRMPDDGFKYERQPRVHPYVKFN